jgi:hypothetical protein
LQLFATFGLDPDHYWAVGDTYTIHEYDGQAWECIYQTGYLMWAVWASAPDDLWTGGFYGGIYHWDGNEWSGDVPGNDLPIYGLWGFGNGDIYAVGAQGKIVHNDRSGWQVMDSGTSSTLNDVWGPHPGLLFAVGYDGVILRHDATSAVPGTGFGRAKLRAAPNPANPGTVIHFELALADAVSLTIFDARGNRVRTLASRRALGAGPQSLPWDGRDDQGRTVPSGVYLVQITGSSICTSTKITMME